MTTIRWKKILVPTDFSEASKTALPYAIGVARDIGAALTLVHVVAPLPLGVVAETGGLYEQKLLLRQAHKELGRFREKEIPSEIAGNNIVLQGNSWQEITRFAGEERVHLIVMATHGRAGLKHLWFGSTAENVVRYAPCSVLTVREHLMPPHVPGETGLRVKRILAPVDFSPPSIAALKNAVALALRYGSRIDVLYVNEPPPYVGVENTDAFRIPPVTVESLEPQIANLKKEVPDLNEVLGNFLVRVGHPAFEIVQAALVLNSDLLSIATHGYTGLKRLVLGSTAEKVVRHARCPVLLWRNKVPTTKSQTREIKYDTQV